MQNIVVVVCMVASCVFAGCTRSTPASSSYRERSYVESTLDSSRLELSVVELHKRVDFVNSSDEPSKRNWTLGIQVQPEEWIPRVCRMSAPWKLTELADQDGQDILASARTQRTFGGTPRRQRFQMAQHPSAMESSGNLLRTSLLVSTRPTRFSRARGHFEIEIASDLLEFVVPIADLEDFKMIHPGFEVRATPDQRESSSQILVEYRLSQPGSESYNPDKGPFLYSMDLVGTLTESGRREFSELLLDTCVIGSANYSIFREIKKGGSVDMSTQPLKLRIKVIPSTRVQRFELDVRDVPLDG